jgi:cysteine desulfurase
MAKALELVRLEGAARAARVEQLRKRLEEDIREIPDLVMNNPGSIPHIVNLSLPYRAARYTQNYLDEQGICVSTGSACSNGEHSPAVFAFTNSMEFATSSFRISLSHLNTEEEIDILVKKLKDWANSRVTL